MRVNGLMIKPMEKVFIHMQMELLIMENGKTINSTGLGLKNGLMEQYMKGIIMKERKMAKVNLLLQTVQCMKEIFR